MDQLMRWTIIFFIIALVAALFGFGGIAGAGIGIAKILFYAFLAVAVLTLVMRLVRSV